MARARSLRGVGGRQRHYRRERKTRAATRRAGDGQIAAHQLGQSLDDGKPETGAAVAARDVAARLRERTEQPLDLATRQPDAAVGDDERRVWRVRARRGSLPPPAERRPRSVNFTALSMRFSSAARSRTASPTSISGSSSAIVTSARKPLVCARALSVSRNTSIRRRGRKISCCNVSEPAIGFGGVDDERGERREMLGAVLDARGPAPLALAEIGARQQFAEREDAGQRGANVVGKDRQRGFVCTQILGRAPPAGAACARRAGFVGDFLDLTRAMKAPWRPAQHATAAAGT